MIFFRVQESLTVITKWLENDYIKQHSRRTHTHTQSISAICNSCHQKESIWRALVHTVRVQNKNINRGEVEPDVSLGSNKANQSINEQQKKKTPSRQTWLHSNSSALWLKSVCVGSRPFEEFSLRRFFKVILAHGALPPCWEEALHANKGWTIQKIINLQPPPPP